MAIWGPTLYQNDIAEDVKYYYIDQLKRGKTSEEVTKKLMENYQKELSDFDDSSVFWFALADTQWNMGRLQDDVKEKALSLIKKGSDLSQWDKEKHTLKEKRMTVLSELENKLLTPQPPKKRISQYRLYRCKWKLGDVFAYKLTSNYAKEKKVYGEYLYFVKVGETEWYPGHVVPIVYFYWVISNHLLKIDDLNTIDFIPQFYKPIVYERNNKQIEYSLILLNTSSKIIPKNNLIFIGNNGLETPLEKKECISYQTKWKFFEKYIINNFQNWDGYQYLVLKNN